MRSEHTMGVRFNHGWHLFFPLRRGSCVLGRQVCQCCQLGQPSLRRCKQAAVVSVGQSGALSEHDGHLQDLRVSRRERAPQPRLHRSPLLLCVVCLLKRLTCAVQEADVDPNHHCRTDRLSQSIEVGVCRVLRRCLLGEVEPAFGLGSPTFIQGRASANCFLR